MADYSITSVFGSIRVGSDGKVSIDTIDAFREAAAAGNVADIYNIAAGNGSNYGVVGQGYYGNPQSLSGWLSDMWTTVGSRGAFAQGNAVYNNVKIGLAHEYAGFVSKHGRMPTTEEVFHMHETVFQRNGISGAWMGSTLPGIVQLGIGIELWDPLNRDPWPPSDAMGNYNYSVPDHCFPSFTQIQTSLRVRTHKLTLQPVRGMIHFSKNGSCHERRFLVDRGAAFASEALLSEAEGQAPGR